jgi:RNA polymerase sigma factor (sigma-70 family)
MEFLPFLKGLRNLDAATLSRFMEKYSPLVMAFIRKRVNPNDVEDATQEFFYHILKVNLFAKFGGETEEAFKAYLVKSALNFSFDWRLREYKLNQPLQVYDGENPVHRRVLGGGDSVHEEFVKKETSDRLNTAIQQLDAQYRRVIELKLLDYSNADVAEILNEPLGSVNTWYTRGIRMLADSLKDLNMAGAKSGVLT